MSWLEDLYKNKKNLEKCKFASYACLEQPETLSYLKYLKQIESSEGTFLNFNSEENEQPNSKKSKRFQFDSIYTRTDKMVQSIKFRNITLQRLLNR